MWSEQETQQYNIALDKLVFRSTAPGAISSPRFQKIKKYCTYQRLYRDRKTRFTTNTDWTAVLVLQHIVLVQRVTWWWFFSRRFFRRPQEGRDALDRRTTKEGTTSLLLTAAVDISKKCHGFWFAHNTATIKSTVDRLLFLCGIKERRARYSIFF